MWLQASPGHGRRQPDTNAFAAPGQVARCAGSPRRRPLGRQLLADTPAASVPPATLGYDFSAPSYTYVEATLTQRLPDWIFAKERAYRYFGGVTALQVPDQLKSAVRKPCRYEVPTPKRRTHGPRVRPADETRLQRVHACYSHSLLSAGRAPVELPHQRSAPTS
jgi:hypothetical protein